ncbi:MAG: hypothetical protein HY864_12825 [Chloroflexi bacterium]|nr:hypothetical protein [Chloroflexota bacterium]
MPNKKILMSREEKQWPVSIGINILAAVLSIPYGIGWFASGMAQKSQECYDSGLFNLLTVTPLAITFASIFFFLLSAKSHRSGQHNKALLQAFFPVIGLVGHLIVYLFSPC